ncbi:MAG: hypothetical protein Kow006_08650 [Gammaproteobacteria bacterium]
MDPAQYKLGENAENLAIETLAECSAVSLALAQQATRSLHIFSRTLDERLYDTAPFLEALRQLAIRSRYSVIQVLVQQPDHAVKNGHRLIELGRRLSSAIHLRTVHNDFREHNEAFLIADEVGFLHRPLADRFEGRANFHDPLEGRELLRFFNKVWEMSSRDPEHLRLHI